MLYQVDNLEFSDFALKYYGVDKVVKKEDYDNQQDFAVALCDELKKRCSGWWQAGSANSQKYHLIIEELPQNAKNALLKEVKESNLSIEDRRYINDSLYGLIIDESIKNSSPYSEIDLTYSSLKSLESQFYKRMLYPTSSKILGDFMHEVNEELGKSANETLRHQGWNEIRKTLGKVYTADILKMRQKA